MQEIERALDAEAVREMARIIIKEKDLIEAVLTSKELLKKCPDDIQELQDLGPEGIHNLVLDMQDQLQRSQPATIMDELSEEDRTELEGMEETL